jgi:formate dehydrogenase major subunit
LVEIDRRSLFKISGAALVGSSAGALGFSSVEAQAATVRPYRLSATTETRNTCTYCSVGCGIIIHATGDGSGNIRPQIVHIEGDPDHPVSRGALCPKGSALLDFVHSDNRVTRPLYRAPGTKTYKPVSWEWAMNRIARLMKDDRDANVVTANAAGVRVNRWNTVGFLAGSATSNETAWLTWKVARSLGIVALDNQARICHGPSVAGLAPAFGRGAMTNGFTDIPNADVVIVMGGNPAEAHTVGFKWVVEAKNRGATLIVVDPRFTRSAAVADLYQPLRPGTYIAFLGGVIKYLIDHNKIHHEYVKLYTNAAFVVKEGFGFEDGLFSGYDAEKREYDTSSWSYELDEQGFAVIDETLQHPRCVFNLMKTHYSRYTPEMVETTCGTPKDGFLKVCELIASTSTPDRTMTSLYSLGWAQHSKGAQNIRTMSLVQLLLGNMGAPGGGINALRGHSNVQGLTDIGLLSQSLPGYLAMPTEKEADLTAHLKTRGFKPLRPNQMSYWQNYKKFYVSFLKAMWDGAATPDNDFGYDLLPKLDGVYDVLKQFELMHQGKMNGYICQGFNPLLSVPNRGKVTAALSKLKWLVVMDPLLTETSRFWENHGEHNNVKSEDIRTEVFHLPTGLFAEDEGTMASSARILQWHWAATKPPGEARGDIEIMADLYHRLKALYRKEGGINPDPVLKLAWAYKKPHEPTADELLRELNGKALTDLADPADSSKILRKAGEQLDGFAQLRDDGSTASACWIYGGSYTEKGNMTARRDNSDPSGKGIHGNWGFAWPANRRILYNRASADADGKAWSDKKKLVEWNGKAWAGFDVPDYGLALAPDKSAGPFIMNAEGVGRLFSLGMMKEGPFPEHYEPHESPIANPFHPKVQANPAARLFKGDREALGNAKEFPYIATTYRLVEHFHFWTKHQRMSTALQPEEFVEISEALAKEKSINPGDWVEVRSNRGVMKVKAVVTKRIRPFKVGGKTVHMVGLPLHWGFAGNAAAGFGVNSLTPVVGDANSQTPEFKAFLVDVKRLSAVV